MKKERNWIMLCQNLTMKVAVPNVKKNKAFRRCSYVCKLDGNLHIKNTEVLCEFVDIQADDFLLVHLWDITTHVQQYQQRRNFIK